MARGAGLERRGVGGEHFAIEALLVDDAELLELDLDAQALGDLLHGHEFLLHGQPAQPVAACVFEELRIDAKD